MKNADLALYAAKLSGRGGMTMFEPDMRSEMQQRLSMVNLARDAIREERIVPYYQPKVDLRTGALVGFEALLRWRHPRRGIAAAGHDRRGVRAMPSSPRRSASGCRSG